MPVDSSRFVTGPLNPSYQGLNDALSGISNAIRSNRAQALDKMRADEAARANRERERLQAEAQAAQVAEWQAGRDFEEKQKRNEALTAFVAAAASNDPVAQQAAQAAYESVGGRVHEDKGGLTPPPPRMTLAPPEAMSRGLVVPRNVPPGPPALKSRGGGPIGPPRAPTGPDMPPAAPPPVPFIPPALRPPPGIAPVVPKQPSFGMKLRDPREEAALVAPIQPKVELKPHVFTAVNPDGKKVVINQDAQIRRGVEAIRLAGAGWVAQASDPIDRETRRRTVEASARAFAEGGGKPFEELRKAQEFTERERNQNWRARITAEAMSAKAGLGDLFKLDAAMDMKIARLESSHGAEKIRETKRSAESFKKLVANGEGLTDRVAMGQVVKSLFGGHASNRDLGVIYDGAGRIESIKREVNAWLEGGKLPENYMSQLNELSELMIRESDWQIHVLGVKAKDMMRTSMLPMSPEQREQSQIIAYGAVTGIFPENLDAIPPVGGISVSASKRTRTTDVPKPTLQPDVAPGGTSQPLPSTENPLF